MGGLYTVQAAVQPDVHKHQFRWIGFDRTDSRLSGIDHSGYRIAPVFQVSADYFRRDELVFDDEDLIASGHLGLSISSLKVTINSAPLLLSTESFPPICLVRICTRLKPSDLLFSMSMSPSDRPTPSSFTERRKDPQASLVIVTITLPLLPPGKACLTALVINSFN